MINAHSLGKLKFSLGRVVATAEVASSFNHTDLANLLGRHGAGDWGEVCGEDAKLNNNAIKGPPDEQQRVLSAYVLDGRKVWIITEWDRSVTTILFPEEY